jgi:hypothetical protein
VRGAAAAASSKCLFDIEDLSYAMKLGRADPAFRGSREAARF